MERNDYMKHLKWILAFCLAISLFTSGLPATEASSKSTTASLQKQIDTLKKQNAALKKENTKLKNEKTKLSKDLSNSKKTIKKLEADKKDLNGQLAKFKTYQKGVDTKSGVVKDIRVTENQASIFLDGQRLFPTVGDGNPIRTFYYENQLYAPVGPVGKLLLGGQKAVEWDSEKQGLYFGTAPKGKNVPISDLKVHQDIYLYNFGPDDDYSFDVLGQTYYPSNGFYGGGRDADIYKLAGNYRSLKGTLAIPQKSIYEEKKSSLLFFSLDSYGNGKLIQKYEIKSGDSFKNVEVDLSGVQFLQIQINDDYSVFHDVSLEGLLD